MAIEVLQEFEKKEFELGQVLKAFRAIIEALGLDLKKNEVSFTGRYSYGSGTTESRDLSLDDLGTIRRIQTEPSSLSMHFRAKSVGGAWRGYLVISHMFGSLHVLCCAPDVETAQDMTSTLAQHLALVRTEEHPFGLREEEAKEGDSVAVPARPSVLIKTGELSCFLSYRFSARSRVLAMEVTRFLELLGVSVVSGAGYEPRRVTDKVVDRLTSPHDFFVYLITKEGESTWTRDEVAAALGRGYAVILLVEWGIDLGKGLLGDWEYLKFEGDHIGDTFVGILEALRFIRAAKRSLNGGQ